jgi:hypothetical protein
MAELRELPATQRHPSPPCTGLFLEGTASEGTCVCIYPGAVYQVPPTQAVIARDVVDADLFSIVHSPPPPSQSQGTRCSCHRFETSTSIAFSISSGLAFGPVSYPSLVPRVRGCSYLIRRSDGSSVDGRPRGLSRYFYRSIYEKFGPFAG